MRRALSIVLLSIIVLFLYCSYSRNAAWNGEIRLWGDTADKSPKKARARNNYGGVLLKAGLNDIAKGEFEAVVGLAPDFLEAYNNLGLIYAGEGLYDEAFKAYKRALMLDYYNYSVHYNLALAYDKHGSTEAATAHYGMFIDLVPRGMLEERVIAALGRVKELKGEVSAQDR